MKKSLSCCSDENGKEAKCFTSSSSSKRERKRGKVRIVVGRKNCENGLHALYAKSAKRENCLWEKEENHMKVYIDFSHAV